MPTRWMCRARLGRANQKKTWHTHICHDIIHIQLIAFFWVGPNMGLSFTGVCSFILRCLVSFGVLSGFVFCPHLVLILINDTPPGESNKPHRSCSASNPHGLCGTLPFCVNKNTHYGLRFQGFCGNLPLRRVWVHHFAHYVTISRHAFICL